MGNTNGRNEYETEKGGEGRIESAEEHENAMDLRSQEDDHKKEIPEDCMWNDDDEDSKGVPTLITWTYGGNNVALEGSWDNWLSRRTMQKSGKDFSMMLVLPCGVYHYRLVVDGEWRHIPDLPFTTDHTTGLLSNVLHVHRCVPQYLQSVVDFDHDNTPPSPQSSYGHSFPSEDEFAKEPALAPSQLHTSFSKPQHVLLNHLFIEKGWPSHSTLALGLTHRFHSKYVTVVLYKPLKK